MAEPDRRAVIFAIDGLKARVFEQYALEGVGTAPPNSFLRRLARAPAQGGFASVSVEQARTVFPSFTFPGWAACFTGTFPDRNGIVGNGAFYRDLDTDRQYDEFSVFSGDEARLVYGWDWNYSRFPEIGCEILLDLTSLPLLPDLFRIVLDGFDDARVWILKPPCWLLHPGFFKPLWPHRESFLNFYASGGVQNDDIQTPTLYDYAHEHGLSTYNIHQFYNRSLNQAGSWDEVYDGDLENMDDSWGRPSYQDVRDFKLPDPDDNRLFDRRGFDKARARLQSSGLPSVFTLYAAAIDGDSHPFRDHGFNGVDAAQFAGLRFVDSEITRFVSELEQQHPEIYEKTLFFLIADHGHTENDAGRKVDLGTLRFPGESSPGDLFRVKENGFMAHLYLRAGDWRDIPTSAQIDAFMTATLPFATYHSGSRLLVDDVLLFVTRDRRVFRNWDGTAWEVFPLSELDDREFGFVNARERIGRLLHTFRAGDVILVRDRSDLPGKNLGFTGSQSTHGSLFPEDSVIPFYVWGEPLNVKRGAEGSVRLKAADIVDLTATVMSWLHIYRPHEGQLDGKPLFDEDLNINLEDFEIFEEDRIGPALEILFGRRVG